MNIADTATGSAARTKSTPATGVITLRERITDVLDAIGLLGVAGGIGAGLSSFIGWWGAAVGGALLIAGSQLAVWLGGRK